MGVGVAAGEEAAVELDFQRTAYHPLGGTYHLVEGAYTAAAAVDVGVLVGG